MTSSPLTTVIVASLSADHTHAVGFVVSVTREGEPTNAATSSVVKVLQSAPAAPRPPEPPPPPEPTEAAGALAAAPVAAGAGVEAPPAGEAALPEQAPRASARKNVRAAWRGRSMWGLPIAARSVRGSIPTLGPGPPGYIGWSPTFVCPIPRHGGRSRRRAPPAIECRAWRRPDPGSRRRSSGS